MIHQLTRREAKVSATPHQKGMKNAPQLNRAKSSQNDFFCDSTRTLARPLPAVQPFGTTEVVPGYKAIYLGSL